MYIANPEQPASYLFITRTSHLNHTRPQNAPHTTHKFRVLLLNARTQPSFDQTDDGVDAETSLSLSLCISISLLLPYTFFSRSPSVFKTLFLFRSKLFSIFFVCLLSHVVSFFLFVLFICMLTCRRKSKNVQGTFSGVLRFLSNFVLFLQPDLQTNSHSTNSLKKFCRFAKTMNPTSDNHPQHHDYSAYLTG